MTGSHSYSQPFRECIAHVYRVFGDTGEFTSSQLPPEMRTHIGGLSRAGRTKCTKNVNVTKYYRLTNTGITYGKKCAVSESE